MEIEPNESGEYSLDSIDTETAIEDLHNRGININDHLDRARMLLASVVEQDRRVEDLARYVEKIQKWLNAHPELKRTPEEEDQKLSA